MTTNNGQKNTQDQTNKDLQEAVNQIARQAITLHECLTPGAAVVVKIPAKKSKLIVPGQKTMAGGCLIISKPIVTNEITCSAGSEG